MYNYWYVYAHTTKSTPLMITKKVTLKNQAIAGKNLSNPANYYGVTLLTFGVDEKKCDVDAYV